MTIGSKLAGVVFGEEIERMDRLFMLLSKTPLIYRQQQKREREMICSQQQLHSTFGEFGRASFSEDERVLRAACLIESSPACSSILPQPAHCIAAQGMEGSAFESTYKQLYLKPNYFTKLRWKGCILCCFFNGKICAHIIFNIIEKLQLLAFFI